MTLTSRQTEVCALASRGRSNNEISDLLGIKHATVQFHLGNIYSKLNVKNRQQLILKVQGIRRQIFG